MGRITAGIGLVTGLNTTDIVNQLIAAQSQPLNLLSARNDTLKQQQTAFSQLTGLLLSVQITAKNLEKDDLYQQRTVTTSDPSSLTATATGTPTLGTSTFTPIQAAQSHQVVSSGVATSDQPLGGGTVSFRFGGFVDQGLSLDLINGGAGLSAGQIRITDRSGASAEIDLRYARTIDDVLSAINDNHGINVSATAVGDHIQLTDGTGQITANLQVQEVGGGSTAASLGLAGINTAASQANGTDIVRLYNGLQLNQLNDGNGVDFDKALGDLAIQFRDGTTRTVDFQPVATTSFYATGTTNAAAGIDGQVKFTAANTGSSLAGVQVVFQNDDSVTAGHETVAYDANAKRLTFHIDAGNTTAADITAALNGDATASGFFTASLAGTGTGVIDTADTATTALPTSVPKEQTLGDVLATLNNVAPSKLKAGLSADGDHIVLTDLTSGGGTFQITAPHNSAALQDLGLTTTAVGGVITGNRLLGGLQTTLLSSLNGGSGFGTLGVLDLTDRSGASASVNLASAQTLDDVITAINSAGLGITASVNDARNGIKLVDTTGGTGNLVVANGDATDTADALKIAASGAVGSVNSGSLSKQTVSRGTLLSSLNGGAGVAQGSIKVTNSKGTTFTVNLSASSIQTVGDVIDKINTITTGVQAQLNDTGDGILLVDTAGGGGTLQVQESGSHTAADLHLLGSAQQALVDGVSQSVINGTTTFQVSLDAGDSLTDLVNKINALGVGVSASQFTDGSAVDPFRLLLSSQQSGKAGELQVDASSLGLSFTDSVKAQDAVLLLGAPSPNSAGTVVASSSNTFTNVLPGATLTVNGASAAPVSVNVSPTTTNLDATANSFVTQYNQLQDQLASLTAFDPTTNTASLLLGDGTALRVEDDLSNLLSGAIGGGGSIHALATVGISVGSDGKLTLDQDQLDAQFAADPDSVQSFFAADDTGFANRFDTLAEQLAGQNNSLLSDRLSALNQKVLDNQQQIDDMNARLDNTREQLLNQFAQLEITINNIRSNLSVIQALAPLSSQTGTSSTSSTEPSSTSSSSSSSTSPGVTSSSST